MFETRISKKAHIHRSASVGPYSIIEDDVEIGARTVIGSHAVIRNGSRIGKDNRIYAGVQIGTDPQDYNFRGWRSQCVIGDRNIIREYATISRATGRGKTTSVGNGNFIMTYVHIAHNNLIGDDTIIASGAQLGGYVTIGDYAVVGGLAGVHQRCRIGRCAMLGAKSYLNQDLPPYLLARGNRARIYGVNVRGLRKRNFTWMEIEQIKRIYAFIRDHPLNRPEHIRRLKKEFSGPRLGEIVVFIGGTRRGILSY